VEKFDRLVGGRVNGTLSQQIKEAAVLSQRLSRQLSYLYQDKARNSRHVPVSALAGHKDESPRGLDNLLAYQTYDI
jgi:hypothetical protein